MAKISVDEVKLRLMKTQLEGDHINEENMITEGIGRRGKKKINNEIEYVNSINDNLFIFKKDDSYILSPADSELSPVIGEFDEMPKDGTMPPCMQDWLATYSKEIIYFQNNEDEILSEMTTGASDLSFDLVDLGLSVNWANMNLGANLPDENGDYYAWGEITIKDKYSLNNYSHYTLIPESYLNIGNNIQKTEYDQAYTVSKTMCLPTEEQWKELQSKCVFTEKTVEGVYGYEVKGPNGNIIFLPFCGCSYDGKMHDINNLCYYHSSIQGSEEQQTRAAKFGKKNVNTIVNLKRRTGSCIRPIATSETDAKSLGTKFIDLGLSVKWADRNLGASTEFKTGDLYAWGDPEANKETFTYATYKYYAPSKQDYEDLGKTISQNSKYDVAYYYDKVMCIPSKEQWEELISKCTWKETIMNNRKVFEITGPNGNKIVLPISGYKQDELKNNNTQCIYTASNIYSSNTNQNRTVFNVKSGGTPEIISAKKWTGLPIRPVSVKANTIKKMIDPIIPYNWGQGAPYNNELPIDPKTNKRVLTGCTQTAMAMIIAYYGCIGVNGKKFRRGMSGTTKYTSAARSTSKINIPALEPISMFDYDNMNFSKKANFKTAESKLAVATLMKYLGYADKASYSSDGTGAQPATAMSVAKNKMHLGINPTMLYASAGVENFKEQIYKELEQGYPVHFSGWNSQGKGGHSFICDGYNPTTGKFHFNFGWDGYYNGWFDVSILIPTKEDDFSYNKRCIIGLHPEYIFGDLNNDNVINVSDIMKLVQSILNKKEYDHQLDINSDKVINEADVEALVNYILGNKI